MALLQLQNEGGDGLGYLQTDAQERLGIHNLLHVQDQKAAGVAGGTFTSGAWRTRDLNTVVVNNIDGASLTSNQITLPAGSYLVSARAPSFGVSFACARLQAIAPASATLLTGTMACGATTSKALVVSEFFGTIIIETSLTFELQHSCALSASDEGFGPGASVGQAHNVFSDLKIWRIGDVEVS